jgi:hypothetical protein
LASITKKFAEQLKALREKGDELDKKKDALEEEIRGIKLNREPGMEDRLTEKRQEYQDCVSELQKTVKEYEGLSTVVEIGGFIESVADTIRLYRPIVKDFITENRPELSACLKDLFNTILDVADDMAQERKRVLKLKATMLYEYYSSLKEAGFEPKEALQIILAQQGMQGNGLLSQLASAGKSLAEKKQR